MSVDVIIWQFYLENNNILSFKICEYMHTRIIQQSVVHHSAGLLAGKASNIFAQTYEH
jgi:hypothetical protein